MCVCPYVDPTTMYTGCISKHIVNCGYNMVHTSSNFFVIREKALYIAFVEPETVTIRSGQDPSDMLIFAPDYKSQNEKEKKKNKTRSIIRHFLL